ncbi:hypothetical protein RHGRI_013922 [Rhododendron griersonianum]|uniref:Uncharacterized protein n=1 Tax=Rhododendron griersonianum TaxID=479676 RepID=A0AAV6K7Q5_9ERIC|nr:hypothetical protein RHGRI_013922 [Rhododendron griersonianum]
MNGCFPHSWKAIHNYIDGPVARIILGWDDSVFKVSVVFLSDQLIVVDVVFLEDKRIFFLSVVYGHNRAGDRRVLWNDMRTMYSMDSVKPWIQLGDFNVVRTSTERLVGFDGAVYEVMTRASSWAPALATTFSVRRMVEIPFGSREFGCNGDIPGDDEVDDDGDDDGGVGF